MVPTPAEQLAGCSLDDGWTVVRLVPPDPRNTGGNFSTGYEVVSREGNEGFLKALDFQRLIAPGPSDTTQRVRDFTDAFVFERDLLRQCRSAHLSRVIRSLSDGEINIGGQVVPYIIFELATGDLRTQSNSLQHFEEAWLIRTMHHVTVGVRQLHGQQIAHQDLKPSNILLTEEDVRKIGDLGRSVTKSCNLPHAKFSVAGDRNHAAPEGLYGYVHPNWYERRFGADVYQLASLLVFMYTRTSLTSLLVSALSDEHRPGNWHGSYMEILPYLTEAFGRVVTYVAPRISQSIRSEIESIVTELGTPDVDRRGDPKHRLTGAPRFNLERYVSRFNRLASSLEHNLYRLR